MKKAKKTSLLYIYQDTSITVSICMGSAQCPHCAHCYIYSITVSICMGSAQCPHCAHCSITVSICMGSAQCPHCAHCYIYIQSLSICMGSAQCPHCVCNADGTALPQFKLCVTLTALPSLFKDNCRPNMDLRDWLVEWCQSKQAHKSLAS